MSAKDPANAYYDNDTRIKRAKWAGFTYANTDVGIIYYTAAVSGGNVTVSVYSRPTMATADLVASSASTAVSTTSWTAITITEENSSGLSAELEIDFTTDAASITAGKQIVTFSFDDDFEVYEKAIADWAPSNTWEGEGSEGCAYVRAHRFATNWAVMKLRQRVKGQVDSNSQNLPNLFDIDLSLEEVRDASVKYALHVVYFNQKNSGDIDIDPFAKSSMIFKQEAEGLIQSTPIHLDTNQDGVIDDTSRGTGAVWV
jgi:hypothetical protein